MTFTPSTIAFFVMALFTLVGGFGVVSSRNLIHAAMYLVLSLFGIAGLYILLEAPFLAAVQLFIYASGMAILIIFTITLTRDMNGSEDVAGRNRQWWMAALVTVALCGVLIWVVQGHSWAAAAPGPVPEDSITRLGQTLVDVGGLALPFEVASVLLLVALIGAVTIARER